VTCWHCGKATVKAVRGDNTDHIFCSHTCVAAEKLGCPCTEDDINLSGLAGALAGSGHIARVRGQAVVTLTPKYPELLEWLKGGDSAARFTTPKATGGDTRGISTGRRLSNWFAVYCRI
jgi:hypothetical protein